MQQPIKVTLNKRFSVLHPSKQLACQNQTMTSNHYSQPVNFNQPSYEYTVLKDIYRAVGHAYNNDGACPCSQLAAGRWMFW